MAERLLILGGTAEGAALARGAADIAGLTVVSSLAGRTRAPGSLPGETRVGGFGGAPAMAEYLRATGTTLVVDATHPYAAAISHNAAEACAAAAVPRLMLVRAAWTPEPGDGWIEVDDADAAAAKVGEDGTRAFLTIGRKEIGAFATPDLIQFAPGLPKTRSGKIMRRILRKIAENELDSLGDTSTLADPAVVEQLIENRANR